MPYDFVTTTEQRLRIEGSVRNYRANSEYEWFASVLVLTDRRRTDLGEWQAWVMRYTWSDVDVAEVED